MRIFTQLKDDFSTKTHVTLRRSSRYRPPENLEMSGVCQPRPKVGGLGGLPRPKLRGCGPPPCGKKRVTNNDWFDWWMDGWIDGWVGWFVCFFGWLVDLTWLIWLIGWLIDLIDWLIELIEWVIDDVISVCVPRYGPDIESLCSRWIHAYCFPINIPKYACWEKHHPTHKLKHPLGIQSTENGHGISWLYTPIVLRRSVIGSLRDSYLSILRRIYPVWFEMVSRVPDLPSPRLVD